MIELLAAAALGATFNLPPGTYKLTQPINVVDPDTEIRLSAGTVLRVEHGSPIGAFNIDADADNFRLTGEGRIEVASWTAGQRIVALAPEVIGARIDGVTFVDLGAGPRAPADPMVFIHAEKSGKLVIEDCQFIPGKGTTCIQSIDGHRPTVRECDFGNEAIEDLPKVYDPVFAWRLVDSFGDFSFHLADNVVWGIGTPDEPLDVAFLFEKAEGTENGHLLITGNRIEAAIAPRIIDLAGVQFFTITGNMLGTPQGEPNEFREGHLILRQGPDGSLCSDGVISGNGFHNPAEPGTEAVSLHIEATLYLTVTGNSFGVQQGQHAVFIDRESSGVVSFTGNTFWSQSPGSVHAIDFGAGPSTSFRFSGNWESGFPGGLFGGLTSGLMWDHAANGSY